MECILSAFAFGVGATSPTFGFGAASKRARSLLRRSPKDEGEYESNMLVSEIQHSRGFDMRREVVTIAKSGLEVFSTESGLISSDDFVCA
jgi:hypothetical protein